MLGWVPELLRKFPELRVILSHGWWSKELTVEAVVAGVRGLFSQEQQTIEAMAKCIQRVRQGELWLNSTEVLHLTDALSKRPMPRCPTRKTGSLTVRQLELAQLVAEGMGNREIAVQLGVTENTVKKHLTKIFEKPTIILGEHLIGDTFVSLTRHGVGPQVHPSMRRALTHLANILAVSMCPSVLAGNN
jgi:DNA-binding NarL/FixJ family response regulator